MKIREILKIKGYDGRTFNIRMVFNGDHYGLDDCLIHDNDKPMVEFFDDTTNKKAFGPLGQFVSRYYCKTLLDDSRLSSGGLCLHGGVPEWSIPGTEMAKVIAFIRGK